MAHYSIPRVMIAALALTFVLAACQNTPTATPMPPTVEIIMPTDEIATSLPEMMNPTDTADDMTTTEDMDMMAPAEINVNLMDGDIDMPVTLQAGRTTFQIVNQGTMTHSFVLTGPGGTFAYEGFLEPGDTATIEADVVPGTYMATSPGSDGSVGNTFEIVVE